MDRATQFNLLMLFSFAHKWMARAHCSESNVLSNVLSIVFLAAAGGIVAEEVVVESSLSVRPKVQVSNSRRVRDTLAYLFPAEQHRLVAVVR